jgi:plastocyanin
LNSKVLMIRRSQLIVLAVGICAILLVSYLWERSKSLPTDAMPVSERVFHMVTGEFKTTTKDGKEIEVYRWDPGFIFVNKGENVKLVIMGVNGESHPFIIEGMNIQGTVTKGKETIVNFHASKEGIYRIICFAHPDAANKGPMIGYIVVD